jgi:hypothetical protein
VTRSKKTRSTGSSTRKRPRQTSLPNECLRRFRCLLRVARRGRVETRDRPGCDGPVVFRRVRTDPGERLRLRRDGHAHHGTVRDDSASARGGRPYPDAIDLRFAGEPAFETAIEAIETYSDQPLSFTDATTVALVDRHDVDYVLAFDDGFDGIVDRLPPENAAE